MRKFLTLATLFTTALILSYCHSSKRAIALAPAKLTFEHNLKSVIEANCTPCHIPSKGGNKKALDNYANVSTEIDEMIRRIELNPGERGFMPFRKTQKLSDSVISVFKQWKADGMVAGN